MMKRLLATFSVVLGGLLPACGDHLADNSYLGDPLVTVRESFSSIRPSAPTTHFKQPSSGRSKISWTTA